jgi:YbbR domain-containing protein
VSLFVPIEVKNPPEDKAVIKPVKRGVQLTLKGPSFLIGPLVSSPPPFKIKLPDINGDRVSISLTAADIALPSSIEVLSIEPSQMEFVFESLERQDVKVEVPRVGQLPNDLILESIEVTPKSVSVRGPRSELKQLRIVESEPLNLSEIEETAQLTLALRPLGNSVSPSSRTVVARVIVGQRPTQKTIAARPVELRVTSSIGAALVKPERVSVEVSGSPAALAALEDEAVIPYLRVSGGKAIEGRRRVEVEVPLGVKVVSVEPSEIEVQLKEMAAPKVEGKKR